MRASTGLVFVDVEEPLRAAVARGVMDVYLPNDTHWGPRGHALVGEAVARYVHPGTEEQAWARSEDG